MLKTLRMMFFPPFRSLRYILGAGLMILGLSACNNDPYPPGASSSATLFNSFDERSPRTLDPTGSYLNPESPYTYSAYEPLYGYHYLKRPYTLVPKVAEKVVDPIYWDIQGRVLPSDAPADQIAFSVYDIPIRKGILFAPHPAFAKDEKGQWLYHHLDAKALGDKRSPWDFEVQGTRELVAEDYVYALKRQATTRIETPISAIFAEYVVGLKDYLAMVREEDRLLLAGRPTDSADKPFLDFRKWPLEGAQALDSHTLRIKLHGKYPQWKYWMAMTFMAPIPWEADAFYSQPGMSMNGLSLGRWPVGTGPFMMTEFIQDQKHVMKRNPHYRGEPYPCEGMPGDREAGMLNDCGKMMPFVDTFTSFIIKEKTPRKELFKQGYLDVPEIERSEWGVDFITDMEDSPEVKKLYESRGFKFPSTTDISNWYMGFNWLDPVVGKGKTPQEQERNRALRHAISIAIDWEEGYQKIFRSKGGVAAHGPVPAGVFGSREGQPGFHNPVTHHVVDGQVRRRPLEEAKALMVRAGYPGGRDEVTGRPLVLNYDYLRTPTPEIKAELDWMVKQFGKLGIQLEIRATDFNQYVDKTNRGKVQIIWGGWLADYPDAENFLFLLYGPNAKVPHQGENSINYQNDEFDRLYKQVQTLDDGPAKQAAIDRMVAIVQQDSPWSFGYFPYVALAFQPWVHNGKPSIMIRDLAKYYRVDVEKRVQMQSQWNRPLWWPVLLMLAALVGVGLWGRRAYLTKQRLTGRGDLA